MKTPGTRDEAGFSLVEVTVAVVFLGLAGVLVLGGLFSIVRASQVTKDQAKVEAVLARAAEKVTNRDYIPCPPASGSGSYLEAAQSAATAVGWPAQTVSIVGVSYLDPALLPAGPGNPGSPRPWAASNTAGGGCDPSLSSTSVRSVQKIVVRVTSPSGSYSRQLEVVKNNVATGI